MDKIKINLFFCIDCKVLFYGGLLLINPFFFKLLIIINEDYDPPNESINENK